MKRIQLQPWTTYEKLCLASAVQRTGDQNWTAVSRAAKNIFDDSTKTMCQERRPPEWFSMKQCAAQYEYLLKHVVGPRRKKRTEKGPDIPDTPAEIIMNVLRQDYVEELKQILAEEQAMYLKIKKENEDIDAGLLDDKLEEIITKIEAKEREKDIRIKLKFKLGEKHLENDITSNKPSELDNTVSQPETEVKPSSATSPLLTSLLQSPSPLTRPPVPSSISLLLSSAPTVPSNESPTLSKLLESPTPPANMQPQEPPPPTFESVQKTPTPIKTEETPKPVEEVVVQEEEKVIKVATPEHSIDDIVHGVVESEVVIEHESPDEKRKPVQRRLDLEAEDVETEEEVMETVEQIIEKVEEAIIETVGETTDSELCDMGLNQTIDSENIEDHLETLDLDHEAVELIVVGPNQGPVIAVHHNETSSEMQSEPPKPIEEKEPVTLAETLSDLESIVKEEEKEAKVEEVKEEVVETKEKEKEEVTKTPEEEPSETVEDVTDSKLEELEKDVVEEHEVQTEVIVEDVVEEVKPDLDVPQVEKVEVESEEKELPAKEPVKESPIEVKEIELPNVQEEKQVSKTPPPTPEVRVEEKVEPEEIKVEEKKIPEKEVKVIEEKVKVVIEEKAKVVIEEKAKVVIEEKAKVVIEEKAKVVIEEKVKVIEEKFKEPEKKIEEVTVQNSGKKKTVTIKESEDKVSSIPRPVTPKPEKFLPPPKTPETPATPEVEKEPETDKKKVGRKRTSLGVQLDSKPNSPASSLTDEDKDYKSWKKSILLVYNRLAAHKYASVFLKPITEAEAAGYHSIIRRPMDLTTIKRNIESGLIRTTVEFQRDMLLMVQNAIMYNKTNTLVFKMANDMLTDMLAQMEVMVQAIGDGVPLSRESYERLPTRGRASKAVQEETPKRKRNSAGDDTRGSVKRKKMDLM